MYGAGDGLDEDAVGRGNHVGAGAFLDLELFAEPAGNDHLAFDGEINGIGLYGCYHADRILFMESKSNNICRKI